MLVNAILGVTGLGNFGEGVSNLCNGEFKNAAKNFAEGSLRMYLCLAAAVTAEYIIKKMNAKPIVAAPPSVAVEIKAKPYERVADFCNGLHVDVETPWSTYEFSKSECIKKLMKEMPDETLDLVKMKVSAESVMNFCEKEFKSKELLFGKSELYQCMQYLFDENKSGKTFVRLL